MGNTGRRHSFIKIIIVCFWISLVITYSCSSTRDEGQKKYYTQPEQKNDGWPVSTPEKEGINPDLIETLLEKTENGYFGNIHNIILIRNGNLVLDAFYKKKLTVADSYVNNEDIELHALMSVTKSLVSLLMGAAINKKIVNSTADKVYLYFPEYKGFNNWSKTKSGITIKNFLTMCHGYDWDESSFKYSDPRNTYYQMEQQNDWVKFTLDREMTDIPGEKFTYSSGISHTIEALISNASGMTFPRFAEKYLFEPLGIKKSKWIKAPNGRADDVYLTGRAMAKLGQLVLNNGKWKGNEIIPEYWIKESTGDLITVSGEYGYGYFWWRYNFNIKNTIVRSILAWGYGGQFIFIFPDLALVSCFTSGNYINDLAVQPFDMIKNYILPAIL